MIVVDVKKELVGFAYDLNRLLNENNIEASIRILHSKSKQFEKYENTDYIKMRV